MKTNSKDFRDPTRSFRPGEKLSKRRMDQLVDGVNRPNYPNQSSTPRLVRTCKSGFYYPARSEFPCVYPFRFVEFVPDDENTFPMDENTGITVDGAVKNQLVDFEDPIGNAQTVSVEPDGFLIDLSIFGGRTPNMYRREGSLVEVIWDGRYWRSAAAQTITGIFITSETLLSGVQYESGFPTESPGAVLQSVLPLFSFGGSSVDSEVAYLPDPVLDPTGAPITYPVINMTGYPIPPNEVVAAGLTQGCVFAVMTTVYRPVDMLVDIRFSEGHIQGQYRRCYVPNYGEPIEYWLNKIPIIDCPTPGA